MPTDPTKTAVWLDDFALEHRAGLDGELARLGATVMRSFGRTPSAATVAQLREYVQLAVISGGSFDELVARLELAVTSLRLPVVALLPPGVPAARLPRGPGLVDCLSADAPDVPVRIMAMSRVPVVSAQRVASRPRSAPTPSHARAPVLAVGSSTGGTWELAELLRGLQRESVGPVLVAQHMEAGFQVSFAHWLEEATGWPVVVVSQPLTPEPGTVYVPEGGKDLAVDADGALLRSEGPRGRFVPSVDRLFASAATAYQAKLVAIVLSGMGDDGARGSAEVLRLGGRALAQLPSTAIISSMPESALRRAPGMVAVATRLIPALLREAR